DRRRRAWRLARRQDVPIELSGCGLRLDVELALQHLDAFLVLPEGCGPTAAARMELHQRAMNALLRRLHDQQTQRGLGRRVHRASLDLVREKAGDDTDGPGAQTIALASEVLLERARAHPDAEHELAFVQTGGA